MNTIKIIWKIILVGLSLIVAFLLIITLYHNYKLRNEYQEYPAPGKLVEINNHKMHIFSRGQGNITLVFLAGSGTSNPTIDFKPLWKKIKDDYRISIVEKAGYGWSEKTSSSRDIDTILEETRKALKLSGEKGPYVLVPHSMSGLEAIYWCQKYPDEVKAVIGIDPAIPEIYLDSSFNLPKKSELYFTYLMSRVGLTRFMDREELEKNIPLLNSKEISEKDKEKLKAMFYKSSLTKNMLNEVNHVKENARKVKRNRVPINIPMYFFVAESSNRNITPNWTKTLHEYAAKINYSKFELLKGGHYIHYDRSELIAEEMRKFLNEIKIN